jgi:hypothetical protein
LSDDSQPQPNLIKVNQCLFGYDDGHRMLACSTKLSSEAHSLLLLLSDLIPGIKLTELGSYWTGVPLRDDKQYVLMRTWPAPEMSRPGCVWTHAVLVSFADMARIVDLGVLRDLTTRPVIQSQYETYKRVIPLDPTSISLAINSGNGRSVSPAHALRLVRAVYGDRFKPDVETKSGELDEALFALWSQQWPRLRRSFAFRTAASKLEGSYPGVRFDLRFVVSSDSMSAATSESLSEAKPWEIVTIDDMRSSEPTSFRRLLWRYGSDINQGRKRFHLLADLYLKTRVDILKGKNLDNVFNMVANKIPSPSDGFTLKEDLVACGKSKFSLLPPTDEVDALAFFVRHPEIDGLPLPPIEAHAAVQKFWYSRLNDAIMLAELAAERNSELGNVILNHLALVAEPTAFLRLTTDRPNLRQRLIQLNPTLLISEAVTEVPRPELLRLLDLIPDDYPGVADKLLTYLLQLDDIDIANKMWCRFPYETLQAETEFLRQAIEKNGPALPLAWRRELERNSDLLLNKGIVEKARSTRFLAELSNILGYDSLDVLKIGPKPWITALKTAEDNICGHERQTFLSFLLALAIRYPAPGSELIFERAFEVVHNDIWNSRLSWEGLSILRRHLPDIGWLASWDNCKRLRIAVVSAYINGNLDPRSFYRLTNDPSLQNRLTDLAMETKKGRRFLKMNSD